MSKNSKNKKEELIKRIIVIDNKRSVMSRKDFVWVDIEFYNGEFSISQKLNNYFAQLEERSNDKIDKINDYISEIYKSLDFNFLFFKENFDIRDDEELFFDDLFDVDILNDALDTYSSEFYDLEEYLECDENSLDEDENSLNEDENSLNEDENSLNEDENSLNEDEEVVKFYVPLALASYRGFSKKSDFYLSNQFDHHLFSKKNIIFARNKILINKFLNNKYIFKMFNFNLINKNFLKFKSLKSNFFKMLNNSNIFFLKKKYYTNKSHRLSKKYRKKKKKKLLMFKKLNLKQKLQKNIILKSFKWFSNVYLTTLLSMKTLHSYNSYSHINFITNIYIFLSQLNSMKLKFFRRYRRRKRLKKSFFRNFEGKLGILNKEINDREEIKKNKRKNKR